MKKLKNMLISIGAFTTIVAPVVTVVSCGNGDGQGTTDHLDDVQIDVSNKSVEETIDLMVKALHVNMDAIGANEDAWSISDDMSKILRYMDQVDTNKTITLVNGTSRYTMDFSPVNQWVNNIRAAAEMEVNPNVGKGSQIGAELIPYGMPEIAVLTGITMGTQVALSMSEFMTLSTDDFSSMSDKSLFFDNHGYIQMLNEYHKIIWEFTQSDFYKEWIVGKQIKLIENGKAVMVNPGDKYDNPGSIVWGITPPPKHDRVIQTTNFEAAFGIRLLNGFGYISRNNPMAQYDLDTYTPTDAIGQFVQSEWDRIKADFTDWSNVVWDEDAWMTMSPSFEVPLGWKRVDYMIEPSFANYIPNPNFATEIGTTQLTRDNAFVIGYTVYFKP